MFPWTFYYIDMGNFSKQNNLLCSTFHETIIYKSKKNKPSLKVLDIIYENTGSHKLAVN